jgi:hypothetical protein
VHWVEFPDGTHSRLHSQFPEQYRQAFHELIGQLSAGRCPTATRNAGAPAAATGGSAD